MDYRVIRSFTWRVPLLFVAVTASSHGPACPVNASYFPPLTCPESYSCCKMPATAVCAESAPTCTVCAECCHAMNATQCSACVASMCKGDSTLGDYGCNTSHPQTWVPYVSNCCGRGVPLPASTTLPNCLLIGDSVTNGLSSVAIDLLKDVCQTQIYELIDAATEAACWGTHRVATDGSTINWDVIVFNEGLHSLWPRVNTSDELAQWAATLSNWTGVLALPQGGITPTLVYATMTPMMAQKWCNPPGLPQHDVENKNAVAVQTVQAAGVTLIEDRYAVITAHCGSVYNNCSWCDNEAQYQCPAYVAAGGFCGFHYVTPGWEALGNSTATFIRAALAQREN